MKRVKVADLKPGPLRHLTLPPTLVTRIRQLHAVFHEFDGQPIEEWLSDFQRDFRPEREVRIWEGMASAYNTFIAGKNLPPEVREEVYRLLLVLTTGGEHKPLHLSASDAKTIMEALGEAYKSQPADSIQVTQRPPTEPN